MNRPDSRSLSKRDRMDRGSKGGAPQTCGGGCTTTQQPRDRWMLGKTYWKTERDRRYQPGDGSKGPNHPRSNDNANDRMTETETFLPMVTSTTKATSYQPDSTHPEQRHRNDTLTQRMDEYSISFETGPKASHNATPYLSTPSSSFHEIQRHHRCTCHAPPRSNANLFRWAIETSLSDNTHRFISCGGKA